jgi:hypothetical protein
VPSYDRMMTERRDQIRAQAEAAANPPPPAPAGPPVHRLAYLWVESMPFTQHPIGDDGFGEPTGYAPELTGEYAHADARFGPELDALIERAPDETRCDVCGSYCGLVSVEPEDNPVISARWISLALVAADDDGSEGSRITRQCERCAPDVGFDEWPPARPPAEWWGSLTRCAFSPDRERAIHVFAPGARQGDSCGCGASWWGGA